MSSLGTEIRKARISAGLTQEKLAFKAELDRTYVNMLEHDKSSPTVAVFLRICKALRIKASEIHRRMEKAESGSKRQPA